MLPDGISGVADLAGDWWVAHAKPRCEKALAFGLRVDGVGYYLPLITKVAVSGGRKRRSMIPVFTSYVFFCGGPEARVSALQTNRVVRVIPVKERDQFVRELQAVEAALAADGQLDLYPFAVTGRRCRVRSGAFEGIEGTIVRRDDRPVLVLQVSILGCGAALEIEPSLLEPIE